MDRHADPANGRDVRNCVPSRRRKTKVFFDGGCRPNPGPIEAAVVVRGCVHRFDDLGPGSSTDAEWLALIAALELAQRLGLSEIELIGDALEVIKQAQLIVQGGRAAPGHAARFLDLAAQTPRLKIRWIKRQQNLAGIALAARHPR